MGDRSEPGTALDPDCADVLARIATWGLPSEPTVELARETLVRSHREFDPEPAPVAAVEHLRIPAGEESVPAIAYLPHGAVEGLVVQANGGGWTHGSPELAAPHGRALAHAGRCVVVSVRYRLAPEHRFPAGLEDLYAVTGWAVAQAVRFGAPAGRTVVAGDSSGGNLAAAVCLMARDRGGPPLTGQLLVYPALARYVETRSRRELATGYGLTPEALDWYWGNYLPAGQDPADPYASPLLAPDLSGLPPAVVVTAALDILRDEAEAYARRLRQAGVAVTHRRVPGMIHAFLAYAGTVRAAQPTFEWIGSQLRGLFAGA